MEQVPKFLRMEINMRENGTKIKHTAKANSGMLMAIIMKGFGIMIKLRDKVCTLQVMQVVI